MKKKGVIHKKEQKKKRGLSEIISNIMMILIILIALAIIAKITLSLLNKEADISAAQASLLQETVKIKKVLIDPTDPSKVQITFCCAQGDIASANAEKGEIEQENKDLDIGLVIDRSFSMQQSGWTLYLDENLNPLTEFSNVAVSQDSYSNTYSFTVPQNTERLAVLLTWDRMPGYIGSEGSELALNLKNPSNNWLFGKNKPNVGGKVDPPDNLGLPGGNDYFSGLTTKPQVIYVETPQAGIWEMKVYGWELKPVDNRPQFQNATVTVYTGTSSQLIRNPTVISYDAAAISSKSFISNMRAQDRISYTVFASTAPLLQTLTNDKNSLLAAVEGTGNQQGTNIHLGIETSRNDLVQNSRKDAQKIMIILTDGQNDLGPALVEQEAKKTKDEGIEIYTIGLSAFVDEDMLKAVSSSSNNYYFASDSSILEDIFESVRERVVQKTIVTTLSDGFMLIFYNETHSYSPDSSNIHLKPLETKTYTFDLADNIVNMTHFEVYPIKIINYKTVIGPLIQRYEF